VVPTPGGHEACPYSLHHQTLPGDASSLLISLCLYA